MIYTPPYPHGVPLDHRMGGRRDDPPTEFGELLWMVDLESGEVTHFDADGSS